MSYLYTKVVVSQYIMGEKVSNTYEEVPIAIHIPDIMGFYKRNPEGDDEEMLRMCAKRHTTLILKDGQEYYIPLTFEQVKNIIDPQGGGSNYEPQHSPYSPTSLTPSI